MNSTDALKQIRLRRERLYRYTHPFVRPFDFSKDANWLWGAYDMDSFPALQKGLTKAEFAVYLRNFLAAKSSVLLVEEDHRYFRTKRGPVAMISVENYGWKIEPQIDFFMWASKRQRLAAAVSFLQMVRYAKEVGVCIVRVQEKDSAFCEHLYKYDLLRASGKVPNAYASGPEYIYYIKGRKTNVESKPLEVVRDERRAA